MAKKKISEIRHREIGEEIQRLKNMLDTAKETAGNGQDSLTPEGFPRVANRDGHTSAWEGNAVVAAIEEELLGLEELKASGATSFEVEYTE